MLASLLGWSLVAGLGCIMASKSIRRWTGPDGEVEEIHDSRLPEIVGGGAMVALACYFIGIGAGAGAAGSGVGSSTTGAISAPNTPTVTLAIQDTSTWWVNFSAFVGSGADTQDSISVTVLRSGAADTLFHAVSGVQSRDTVSDNADLKADTTYRVLGRQKGATGGWSTADTVSLVNQLWGESKFCETGPNYPSGTINDKRFCLDVTQSDQTILNTVAGTAGDVRWTTPQTSPDNGAFFNQTSGDTVFVDFRWKAGQVERAASLDINLHGSINYCSRYSRFTFRANAGWENSGGTVKLLFWNNNSGGINAAPSLLSISGSSGAPAYINVTPNTSGGSVDFSTWVDLEYLETAISTDQVWWRVYNGSTGSLIVQDTVDAGTTNQVDYMILGPFHGGSGAKSSSGDFWRYSRHVSWFEAC